MNRSEILQAVGSYLFEKRNYHALDREQTARIIRTVRSGERKFYNAYPWSFLRPRLTVAVNGPYSTGTVGVSNGVAVTTDTWPTWAADGWLTVDGVGYEVATRNSGSAITLVDTSVNVTSGASYVIERWQYTLPDDFGGLSGPALRFEKTNGQLFPVKRTDVDTILNARQLGNLITSTQPELVAVAPVGSTAASAGQRFELLLFPTPTVTGTLHGQYHKLIDQTSDSLPYPFGGAPHAETVLESCLAAAELEKTGQLGPHRAMFQECLAASIQFDKRINAGKNLGINADYGSETFERHAGWNETLTYNDVALP